MNIIAQFLLRLVCGMSLMWCLMPRKEVTAGFFRIQSLVALGLSVLAALTIAPPDAASETFALTRGWGVAGCVVLAVAAYLSSFFWTLNQRTIGTALMGVICLTATCLLLALGWTLSHHYHGPAVLALASELATAALLGSAVTGMLLGHWYLTSPTMSIAPLYRMTLLFGLAVLLKLVLALVGLSLAWGAVTSSTHWMWLTLRWCAGLFGPLILSVMVWKILKYRNTQSATGVLFAGVILTFIGELTAVLLSQELLYPL